MSSFRPTRRSVLLGGATVAIGGSIVGYKGWVHLRQPKARVAVVRAASYDEDLVDHLLLAIREFPHTVARAKGARVVLKPNLVEFAPDRPINTDARVIVAAAEAFRRLGAKEVVVAEGPGHRRDTEYVVEATGLREILDHERLPFVDLNADTPAEVKLSADLTGLGRLKLAGTAVGADLLVSVAKLKTHHWAGATLTMKNLFGTVPGSVYGWPKNPLHHAGLWNSIVDIWMALRPAFGIVDGIVGMEGDGPIMGSARHAGVLICGESLSAVDATAMRHMGLRPELAPWMRMAVPLGATCSPYRIEVVGDRVQPVPFEVLDLWKDLRA